MSTIETAQQRLARNRTLMVQWIDHDRVKREAFSHTGLGQFTALPWVRSVGNHPLAGLALGALTKWWMKPREGKSSAVRVLAMGTGWKLLRRHPMVALATVALIGTGAWWFQRRQPSQPNRKL